MVLRTHNPPDLAEDAAPVGDPLAGYRADRAQAPLFDVRDVAGAGYDELIDESGAIRPAWQELTDCVRDRGRTGLDQLRGVVRELVDNDGISYVQVDRDGEAVVDVDGSPVVDTWQLDALPLVMSSADWRTLESGLVQRSRLLDAVLTDLYGARRAITSGVLPPELLYAHPGYLRAARGIAVPGRHQLFLHGCDVSRQRDGGFSVNADWTQAPSGAGYALADRRVVAHAVPELYEKVAPRPASPWAQALRLALIDAAPEAAREPVVVVLSPGSHSEPRSIRPTWPACWASRWWRAPTWWCATASSGCARSAPSSALTSYCAGWMPSTPIPWICVRTPASVWSAWSRCCVAAR